MTKMTTKATFKSPSQNEGLAFSFGVPSVDTIIDRYLGRNQPESSITSQIVEAHRESNVHQLNMELTQLMEQLETKKKLGEELHQREKANQRQYWCQKPVEELDLSHLQQLKSAMDGFKRSVQAQKVAILNVNPHQSFLGSSSQGLNPIHDFNNMMDGGYFVPHMSVPPSGYNLNHVQGYSANPLEGFNLNPVQRYNVNPDNRYNTNSQEINILGHGFGGTMLTHKGMMFFSFLVLKDLVVDFLVC
ncbi:hypothetical protein F3Y22_tig00109972pilonHSYRG00214 [Hibiscus syriacus]|uniref:Agamous-like MADS-box protein AGL62 n=1 Tax=Hibiscus syriacus TaxID=106335 RepID=A0A6A3BTA5_HIBSY|nr:hypothetical protein F3Y22_tig00109972pilonHSYRG00214 [Hibiscus syriacus]